MHVIRECKPKLALICEQNLHALIIFLLSKCGNSRTNRKLLCLWPSCYEELQALGLEVLADWLCRVTSSYTRQSQCTVCGGPTPPLSYWLRKGGSG